MAAKPYIESSMAAEGGGGMAGQAAGASQKK